MVIRGYLTGHAWRQYKAGHRELCGAPMPDGMKEHDRFPEPIITPATKAEEGHDEDIPLPTFGQRHRHTRIVVRIGTHHTRPVPAWHRDGRRTRTDFGGHQVRVWTAQRCVDHRRDPHARQLSLLLRGWLRAPSSRGRTPKATQQGIRARVAHGKRLHGQGWPNATPHGRRLLGHGHQAVRRTVRERSLAKPFEGDAQRRSSRPCDRSRRILVATNAS